VEVEIGMSRDVDFEARRPPFPTGGLGTICIDPAVAGVKGHRLDQVLRPRFPAGVSFDPDPDEHIAPALTDHGDATVSASINVEDAAREGDGLLYDAANPLVVRVSPPAGAGQLPITEVAPLSAGAGSQGKTKDSENERVAAAE
jgi:hypothetical protein